ncbi:GNVR domain-containing protein, partial [Steroidobacter sp.]|uniref:GNVR domain-containing protein n=1 Tax=Steroidobacter sp. TaxID=1978227 RepID=UPI001A4E6DC7
LDSLLQRFTEDHPDVIGAKRVIAQLEEQRRREASAKAKNGVPKGAATYSTNPVYRELKVSLAREEANVASLRTRAAEYEARYRQLKDKAALVPRVEAELAQLNRDYEINKKNYELLVSRRESAEISGDMESAEGDSIRIVEPPRVSRHPVFPNRPLLILAALAMALGAGIAASFLLTRIWPTFADTTTLREVSGLPVLGGVTLFEDDGFRRRSRAGLIGFVTGVGALIVAYGAFLATVFLAVRSA